MTTHFTEASSLASIDRQLGDDRDDISPAQYEIIRQVIYNTADFEYYDLLRFSPNSLSKGFAALKKRISIIVDVPEIQVSIVPKLRHTFLNPVFCCATTGKETDFYQTKASVGLENLAPKNPNGIFAIGQDSTTLNTFIKLVDNKTIDPSLTIATAPSFTDLDAKNYFQHTSFPVIYVQGSKGGSIIAAAIINALVELAWRVRNY